jgi:hypothetical protein
MAFGGFLGMGDKHHPLPWAVLKYDATRGGYVVDLDKEMLENAPNFDPADADVDWGDEIWGRKLHDYYGVQPYWL